MPPSSRPSSSRSTKQQRTLCIDIGGTGTKAMVLDGDGKPLCERVRLETPSPATPVAVFTTIRELVKSVPAYDRISVGFPGVVARGVVRSAPNLDPSWKNVPIEKKLQTLLGKPVRAANDAGVQGLGVIRGKGTEIVVTLGTGMGFGLYVDGRYVPNIELAHHPAKKGKTYEELLGNAARKKEGNSGWNKRLRDALEQIAFIFNYDTLYLGGGNTKHVDKACLPPGVRLGNNIAGILGGIRLWDR